MTTATTVTTGAAAAMRPMQWWDIPAVHELEVVAFPDTAWSPETFWSELAGVPDTRHFVVAANEEQIVGYAGLMAIGREADIQTLAVAHDARRAGCGTRLLDALLDEALARGCTRVTLEVASTAVDAQTLYLRRGFDIIGRRSGYYGNGLDALIMRLRLSGLSGLS